MNSVNSALEDLWRIWHNIVAMIELPEYAQVVRTLGSGTHPFRSLLPRFEESPAALRIETAAFPIKTLLDSAHVRIKRHKGYCYVDVNIPAIILSIWRMS